MSQKRAVRGVVTGGDDENVEVPVDKANCDDPNIDDEEIEEYGCCYWPGGPTIVNVGTHESPTEIIGGSAYVYFLMPNFWAFMLGLTVVAFQCYLLIIMWRDAEEVTNEEFRANETDRILGIVGASILLALRNLASIGQGFELIFLGLGLTHSRWHGLPTIYANTRKCDVKLVFVGVIGLLVSALSVCVGIRFSINRGASIIRTITNTAVAVFIEGIDEAMYSFLKYWSVPGWHTFVMKTVEKKYGCRNSDN